MATIFTSSLVTNNSTAAGYSFRQLLVVTGASLGQVRATFQASSASAWATSHCSIGVAATAPNTAATPVELTFAGASGFSLTSSQTITSDWATISFLSSDHPIVIMDISSGLDCSNQSAPAGNTIYFQSGTSSWNLSNAGGGFSNLANRVDGVNLLETQSGSGAFFSRAYYDMARIG